MNTRLNSTILKFFPDDIKKQIYRYFYFNNRKELILDVYSSENAESLEQIKLSDAEPSNIEVSLDILKLFFEVDRDDIKMLKKLYTVKDYLIHVENIKSKYINNIFKKLYIDDINEYIVNYFN